MSYTKPNGRLGNQIIRNLSVSIVVQKFNLKVSYSSHDLIKQLGIELYSGKNKYNNTIILHDKNYFNVLLGKKLESNISANKAFFQTKEISNFLYQWLHNDKNLIINANPFKKRYNENNDCFIHLRLKDAERWNPGIDYYLNTLKKIKFNKLFIASDDLKHNFVKTIVSLYPNTTLINYDPVKTIQFGSTCKTLILSHGSFSAVIGFLGFYSEVHYKTYGKMWHGDMFSIPGWIKEP